MYGYLSWHNVIMRSVDLLKNNLPNHMNAERVDIDLSRGSKYAENCCRRW